MGERRRYSKELDKEIDDIPGSFDVREAMDKGRADEMKNAGEAKIPLYGFYGNAFFSVKPSKELMEKERERFYENDDNRSQIDILEKGLCKKFGVPVPVKKPNRRGDRGTAEDEILILGETANDPRNKKLWGVRQEDRTRHSYLIGPSGSGKPNPRSTPVLSKSKYNNLPVWRQMGELEEEDLVYTRNGNFARIVNITEFPDEPLWEIELADGQIAECGGGHLWIVKNKSHGRYRELVMTTEELFEAGVARTSTSDNGSRHFPYSIPLCSPMDFPEADLPIPPYTLGLLIGDGYTCSASGSIYISTADTEIFDLMRRELGDEYQFKKSSPDNNKDYRWEFREKQPDGSYHVAKKMRMIIRELGLEVLAHGKFIPDIYKYASIEQRRALLKGLMDSDGSASKGRFNFHTTSKRLYEDTLELIRSLGYMATTYIDTHKEYVNVECCYVIHIHSNDYENIFGLSRKKQDYLDYAESRSDIKKVFEHGDPKKIVDACSKDDICDAIPIVDVRKTNRKCDMRCIYVDDPSHSYIIEGYIVTHNSTLLHALGVEDMWYWRGGLLMEPHGDLARGLLRCAPPYRIHDIIYLNVLDPGASPGFNPLELPLGASDEERAEAVGKVTSLIAKHFNMESGMVRLNKMLENALVALSYVPGATLLEIMDFYTNPDIRASILSWMPDGSPQKDSIASIAEGAKADELASLENRLQRFSTNRYLRHMFGQSHTTVDFYDLMNQGCYIICPISKGGTTDDTFLKFYGSYVVSEVYKSAVMREAIEEDERVNFAMTLDEFQNFLTGDIEGILSEARKYGLCLMLAHQYLDQLDKETKSAVLQNCATKLVYNLGPIDAPEMARTFAHGIKADDLMAIPKYHVMAAPLVNGENLQPFISAVFPPIKLKSECAGITADLITEISRNRYMKNRDKIDEEIQERKERLLSGNRQAMLDLVTKKNS